MQINPNTANPNVVYSKSKSKKNLFFIVIGALIVGVILLQMLGGKPKPAPTPAPESAKREASSAPGSSESFASLVEPADPQQLDAALGSTGDTAPSGLADKPASDPAAAAAAAPAAAPPSHGSGSQATAPDSKLRANLDEATSQIDALRGRIVALESAVAQLMLTQKAPASAAGKERSSHASGTGNGGSKRSSKANATPKPRKPASPQPSSAESQLLRLSHGPFQDRAGSLVASITGSTVGILPTVEKIDSGSYAVTVKGANLISSVPSAAILGRIEALPLSNGDLRLSYSDPAPFDLRVTPTPAGFDVEITRGPRQLMATGNLPPSADALTHYSVQAALPDSAVLFHQVQRTLHTVFQGTYIPGCGLITQIYPQTRQIQTQCGMINARGQ